MFFDTEDARSILAALAGTEQLRSGRDFLITVVDDAGEGTTGRITTRDEPDGLVLLTGEPGDLHHVTIPWDKMRRICVELGD